MSAPKKDANSKTVKNELNEIVGMGELLISLGESLESSGGSMSLTEIGLNDRTNCEDCTMGLGDFLEHMARNGIRFCVKGKP
jgi:hypothetical protein